MQRIKSRSAFDNLFETGQGIKQFPFRLVWMSCPYNEKHPVKIAVVVPKRNMRKAFQRNRMKRLMREAYRLNKNPIVDFANNHKKGFLLLFIVHVNNPVEFAETQEKIILLLQRLIALHELPPE